MRFDIAARRYLGVRYLHQGRDPAVGLDCIGLLTCAARDCGLTLVEHDRTDYGPNPHGGMLEQQLRAAFGSPSAGMSPGCVIAIAFPVVTRHVAIIGEGPHGLTMIHTYNKPARVIEHRLDERWCRRITGIYRVEL